MTDCPDGLMRDLLPEYAHGALAAADAARVAEHLAACAECRHEVVLLGRLRDGMTLGVPRIDVAAIVAALPAPRAGVRPAARRWTTRHAWQYAVAAGLVLSVGSGIVWQRAAGSGSSRVADSTRVRSAVGTAPAQSAVTREDGGISFGGGLSDLSVNDLQALLGQVDSLRALPSTDPASMTPVIAMNEGGKTL